MFQTHLNATAALRSDNRCEIIQIHLNGTAAVHPSQLKPSLQHTFRMPTSDDSNDFGFL